MQQHGGGGRGEAGSCTWVCVVECGRAWSCVVVWKTGDMDEWQGGWRTVKGEREGGGGERSTRQYAKRKGGEAKHATICKN